MVNTGKSGQAILKKNRNELQFLNSVLRLCNIRCKCNAYNIAYLSDLFFHIPRSLADIIMVFFYLLLVGFLLHWRLNQNLFILRLARGGLFVNIINGNNLRTMVDILCLNLFVQVGSIMYSKMWYCFGLIPGYLLFKALGYFWEYIGTNRYVVIYLN